MNNLKREFDGRFRSEGKHCYLKNVQIKRARGEAPHTLSGKGKGAPGDLGTREKGREGKVNTAM